MGMFDTIKEELFCPYCGTKQKANDFQTKDFGKSLNSLSILEIKGLYYNIYNICFNCNNWIELNIRESGIYTLKEGKIQIAKRKRELAKLFETKKAQKSTTPSKKKAGHNSS